MKPLEVKGKITEFTAYDEYEIIQKNTYKLNKAVTLTGLRRVVSFDEEGRMKDKFIAVRKVEDLDKEIEGEVLTHPKCIYTIVEDGRWLNGEKNIDNEVEDSLRKIAKENTISYFVVAIIVIVINPKEV